MLTRAHLCSHVLTRSKSQRTEKQSAIFTFTTTSLWVRCKNDDDDDDDDDGEPFGLGTQQQRDSEENIGRDRLVSKSAKQFNQCRWRAAKVLAYDVVAFDACYSICKKYSTHIPSRNRAFKNLQLA